jgi:hypothetical protein
MCLYLVTTCCRDCRSCCTACLRDCNPAKLVFNILFGFPAGLLLGLVTGLLLTLLHLLPGTYNHCTELWSHVCSTLKKGQAAYTSGNELPSQTQPHQAQRDPLPQMQKSCFDCLDMCMAEVYCFMLPVFALVTLILPLLVLTFLLVESISGGFATACAGCVDVPATWWKHVSQSLRVLNSSLAATALRPGHELQCLGVDDRHVLPQTNGLPRRSHHPCAPPPRGCAEAGPPRGSAPVPRHPNYSGAPAPGGNAGAHPPSCGPYATPMTRTGPGFVTRQPPNERQQEPDSLLNVAVQAAANSVAQSVATGLRNALNRRSDGQTMSNHASSHVHSVQPAPLPRAVARAMPVSQPVVGTAVPMGRVVR